MEPVNEEPAPPAEEDAGAGEGDVPRYEKPVIRRYDQIDQVRPYGPSEV
jgi:hypothetical protein